MFFFKVLHHLIMLLTLYVLLMLMFQEGGFLQQCHDEMNPVVFVISLVVIGVWGYYSIKRDINKKQ